MRRKDVDDVAANGNFSRFLDERHALVADTHETGDEQIAVERLTDRSERAARDVTMIGASPRSSSGRVH